MKKKKTPDGSFLIMETKVTAPPSARTAVPASYLLIGLAVAMAVVVILGSFSVADDECQYWQAYVAGSYFSTSAAAASDLTEKIKDMTTPHQEMRVLAVPAPGKMYTPEVVWISTSGIPGDYYNLKCVKNADRPSVLKALLTHLLTIKGGWTK